MVACETPTLSKRLPESLSYIIFHRLHKERYRAMAIPSGLLSCTTEVTETDNRWSQGGDVELEL